MKHLTTAVIATVLFFVGGMSVVFWHKDKVHDSVRIHNNAVAQNRYVDLVSRTDDISGNSGVAHLARFIQPAAHADQPVPALLDVIVPKHEFRNVNNIIHTDVAYLDSDYDLNPRTGEYGDGHLTSEFVILTLSAIDSPEETRMELPPVDDDGYFTWTNALLLSALPMTVFVALIFPLMILRSEVQDRHELHKKQRYLSSLSSEAREIYEIRESLARNKPSESQWHLLEKWKTSPEGRAWAKADKAFHLATSGWSTTENLDRLERLSRELDDMMTALRAGQQTYKEL